VAFNKIPGYSAAARNPFRAARLPAAAAAVLLATATGLLRADAPYNTPTLTVKVSAEAVLATPAGSDLAQFPGLFSLDRVVAGAPAKRTLATWDVHPDVPGTTPPPRSGKRDDGGLTFPFTYSTADNGLLRLRDGRLFGVAFTTRMLPLGAATGTSEEVDSYVSADEGLTFAKTTGTLTTATLMKTVNAGSGRGGFVFHRGLWQANDGTIYATFYGFYNTDTASRTIWCKTTNLGATWSVVSSAVGTGGTNEAAVAQCGDGSLLAVMRGPEPYLYSSRSTDGGATWSAKALLAVGGTSPVAGVSPELKLLPNGVLLLASGRPDDWIAVSVDHGATWTHKTTLYTGATYSLTSGYQAIADIEPQMALVAYDTGATGSPTAPSPNPFSIRAKEVNVVRGPVQRLDLKTKAALGLVTVTTNMTYSDPNLPSLRPEGAFDGSSYYWAAAFKDGSATDGSFVLHLDKPYTITNLGILLKRGYPESASVYFSTDSGATWGSPVKTYTAATHYAIDYTTLTPVPNVNAVKVTTVGAWTGLNELELYTSYDTFENESDLNVPSYWTNVNGFGCFVTSGSGCQSYRALRVYDYLTTGNPLIKKLSTNSSSKTIRFQVYPDVLPNGFIFDVKANVTAGADVAFHFLVTATGAVQWYNGSAWVALAPAGTVPVGAWSSVQINATLSSAQLLVNGVAVGSAGIYAQPGKTISSLSGLAFGGYGTAPAGDSVYFDDVELP
jgi:hypothetical protein